MLEPPAAILDIFDTLEGAGHDTWCVGGAVRDAILGVPNADWDLATAATPDQVMRLFRRTVKLGVEHGTVGVIDRHNVAHEVTTFRRDVETDGRHAVVAFGASLEEDLARRDFTINAIAYKPRANELRDPFGGREDLKRRIVRAVGDPTDRLREDRLRALRAIRFAARFEFDMDDTLWAAIVASVPHLVTLSAERVSQELEKTMEQVVRPSVALKRWIDSGAMRVLVPALGMLDELDIAGPDYLPMARGPRAAARKEERLAALFVRHDEKVIRQAAATLRFSKKRTEYVASLAGRWLNLGGEIKSAIERGPVPSAEIRRWVAVIGRLRVDSFWRIAAAVWAADKTTGQNAPDERVVRTLYKRSIRAAFNDPVEVADLALDGNDLLAIGIPPGPEIREILEMLLQFVIADPSQNNRDRLLDRVRER